MKRMQEPLRVGGFTLMELMIVVIIISILAVIAVPSYNRYAYRARRAEGQGMLMKVAVAQERYYATYNNYAGSVTTDLKFATDTTDNGYYKISIGKVGTSDYTTAYIATATVQLGQTKDACGNLTIDSRGTKSQTGQTNVNGTCW
ncbi:type IV pilus assembly protein PilE [Luteibacter rhizovicinus]|uniref:Type IV pilus assembly protein PilE n=1 Tax=Luteibacter rhizovicinus TaxID=242606 RepID=A0A4R3YWX5_9GAMM|nr:type IV pilin protein [Luteibacter rhizovicinus]TCV97032.1 type IV pilus assembly protein PilE [Luteibacter rhizovicinus]